MANMIVSFSIPVNSEAAKIIEQWKIEDGYGTISAEVRAAIEARSKTEALERKVAALSWCLAQRGVCPVTMKPEQETDWKTGEYVENTGPMWSMPHSCENCEKYTGTPIVMAREGGKKWPRKMQKIVGRLKDDWYRFPWRRDV